MSDLIRKSSLIYKLQHWREKLSQEYGENDEYVRCLDSVLDVYISDAPTVDAVEVVRCEECRKFKTYKCEINGCNMHTDFCSYGERKEASE